MGHAVNDSKLIRTSLVDILRDKEIKHAVLEGLIAVLLGDTEVEESIKVFC